MALHVNSSSYDVAEFSSSHSAGAKLILDADATGGTEFALQSTADGAGTGGGKLDFVNAGNSRMVLTAAGNLGIGITTPASSLHINGTGDQKIILKSASANSEGLVIASAAGSERVDFSTDGANVMCFTAADKVGIGTTSPNSKMTVQGDLDVPVNSRFRAGSGDSNHTGVDIYHDGSNNYTLIENRPSGGDLIFRQMHNGKDYIFKADNDSGTEQEVMRIDGSNARVGIGTAAPDVALDVRDAGWPIAALHGTSEYGTGIQLYNTHTTDQAWAIIGGGTSQSNYPLKFYDQTNAVYRMVLDNTGKLGIGTTEPTEVLDVRSANNTLALFKSSDNRGLIQVADDDTTVSIVAENSTLSLGLTSSISASNLNIDSAGNVGIGTTTPDYTLELENTAPQLGFNDTNGRKFYLMSQSDKFWLGDATGGTTPLVVDSAGNVGIGTSSPSNPLHIAGHVNPLRLQGTSTGKVELGVSTSGDFTIDADDDIRLDSGGQDIVLYGQGSQFARLTNASTDFEILTTTQDRDLIFKGNDGGSTIEAMRIDYSAGGFVGIGTTAPAYKLDVFGDARVKGTASHQTLELRGDTGYGAYINYVRNNGSYAFRTGMITDSSRWDITDYQGAGYEALSVTADLKVGINTTSPAATLQVAGDAKFADASNNVHLTIQETGTNGALISGASSAGLYFATDSGTRIELTGNHIIKTGQTIDNMLSYATAAVHTATTATQTYQVESVADPGQAGVTRTTTLNLPNGNVGGERFTVTCIAVGNFKSGTGNLTGEVVLGGNFINGTNFISPNVTSFTGATAAGANVMQVKTYEFTWVAAQFNTSTLGGWVYTFNTM
jgi:hypothetical protein